MDLSKYTVEANGTLLDVAEVIAANLARCAIVIENGKTVGVISEGDLVRALLRGVDLHSSVDSCINHSFIFLQRRNLRDALDIFRAKGVSLIPVVSVDMSLEDVITLQECLAQVSLIETPG